MLKGPRLIRKARYALCLVITVELSSGEQPLLGAVQLPCFFLDCHLLVEANLEVPETASVLHKF